jgi:hypothetical protein
METFKSMRGQFNSHLNSVNDPTKNNFAGCPGGIAFSKIFDRNRLLPEGGVGCVQGAEHLVQCVEEEPTDGAEAFMVALGK